jgi:hypothetical protein
MAQLPPNPANFDGLAGGLSMAVMGPPGTGKSTLLGSCGRLGPCKLLACKPREANSWLYRETGITADAEVFHDPRWRPSLDKFVAEGFVSLIQRLWDLYDDKNYDFVLFDPYTDAVLLAIHELLKVERKASFAESSNSQGLYGSLRQKLEELTGALTALQFAPKPKHVLISVHTQAPKDDIQLSQRQGGGTKESTDNRAQGVEYEGKVLPMIEGGYRTKFAGDFDLVVFSDVKHEKKLVDRKMVESVEYVVQVAPDPDRHAKQTLGSVFAEKTLPNDFAAFLAHIRKVTA